MILSGIISEIIGLSATSGEGPSSPAVTETEWTNAAGNNLWEDSENWSDGVPSATISAIMGGTSNAECIVPSAAMECLDLDLTGYTGNIHVASSANLTLKVFGDATLDGACTTSGYIKLNFAAGDHDLTSDGFAKVWVNAVAADSVTFLDACNLYQLDGTGDVVFDSDFDLTLGNGSQGIFNDSTSAMTGSGSIVVTSNATVSFEGGTGTWLGVELGAACEGVTVDDGTKVASWTMAGGDLDCTGAEILTVTGAFAGTGGTMTSANVVVTGAATAADMTIVNTSFAGGTELDATDECEDGGGNTNIEFPPPVTILWDPANKGTSTLSNADRTAADNTSPITACFGTGTGKSAGKYYVEYTIDAGDPSNLLVFGLIKAGVGYTTSPLQNFDGTTLLCNNGSWFKNGALQGSFGAQAQGSIIGMIFDFDALTFEFFKNNVSIGTGAIGNNSTGNFLLAWSPQSNSQNVQVTLASDSGQMAYPGRLASESASEWNS